MLDTVKHFRELSPELYKFAGGKGGMLAKMFKGGYPVPEGFVILPSAFREDILNNEAWQETQFLLNEIRKNNKDAMFAVRSSALSEDSKSASFAGEFETVLNAETDDKILEAIYTVFNSRNSQRVKVYSSVQGVDEFHRVAVVVQLMVNSEVSGVLFSADPITGSYVNMIGNYVHGLGEQLVSGESDAFPFRLMRPKGRYSGPDELKKYASDLYEYASKLEKEMKSPQDIEWAVADGKLYLLQCRPITTLTSGNLDTYEINESLSGDSLWVNTNVGEAIPDVITPLTWSIVRSLDVESGFIPGYFLWSGNICGRIYSNISQRLSAITALYGFDVKRGMSLMGDLFGQFPEGMNVPVYPFARLELIKIMFPRIKNLIKNTMKASKNMHEHNKNTPEWCRNISEKIKVASTPEELLSLWNDELQPYNSKAWWIHVAGGSKAVIAMTLSKKLNEMVGAEDSNALLSNLRGDSVLASLGPVVGISNVVKGSISREEYLELYGHRGPHEFELSISDPSEDESWLERQINEFTASDTDVDKLLNEQRTKFEDALKRYKDKFPNKTKWLDKQLKKAAEGAQNRESARSELVRVFRINRAFALKAGEIIGIGEDVFFLYIDDIINVLTKNDESSLMFISARKTNYEKFKELPPFPSIIKGRFNPSEWIKDENRRMDYYDSSKTVSTSPDSEILKGFPGAGGKVEGTVRVLLNPEDGDKLQQGEILVATTTNVGWTPLFPRAAAVVTDVGAPLSHAAIVAREMGIPAVVGCGNATLRLKTGDRVIVDGGNGIVEKLKK